MMRTVTRFGTLMMSVVLGAACGTPAGSAATQRSTVTSETPATVTSEKPLAKSESAGTPDLSRGIDQSQFQNPAYQEKLSDVTQKLGAVSSVISAKLADNPNLVNVGVMPGANTVVVYWSGSVKDPALSQARKIAKKRKVSILVAPRKVSKRGLEEAESRVEKNEPHYRALGIVIGTYGGFAAFFDGITIGVDSDKSTNKDVAAIQRLIESDVHVPAQVTFGGFFQ